LATDAFLAITVAILTLGIVSPLPARAAGVAVVELFDDTFNPETVRVEPGDRVRDRFAHTFYATTRCSDAKSRPAARRAVLGADDLAGRRLGGETVRRRSHPRPAR